MRGKYAMRIVFLGDSLTEGVDGASYLRALNERIASDPQLRGATLINAGRGGDTVLNAASRVARGARRSRWRCAAPIRPAS